MSKISSDTISRIQPIINKVPEITIMFWIIKVLTTGMGEVASDYFVNHINPVIAVGFAGICLALSMVIQFSVCRYVEWIYWLNVIMVSIFGTMAADVVHIAFGVPYLASTAFFIVILGIIFIVWYSSEKNLSMHSINTPKRELFYWATVLITFALGTASGDMTATTMHLGYFFSGVMFAAIIAIPAIAHFAFGINEVFTFWFAYIVTRPLGASFADWMGVSHERGGLGLGTGSVSLVLVVIIFGLVGYVSVKHKNIKRD
jgi:uncharacterized membrane-anchored protein